MLATTAITAKAKRQKKRAGDGTRTRPVFLGKEVVAKQKGFGIKDL